MDISTRIRKAQRAVFTEKIECLLSKSLLSLPILDHARES